MDDARRSEGLAVRALMLGTLIGAVSAPDYPVKIRAMEEWLDKDEVIQAVSVVTGSGLRLKISVEFEGEDT